MVCNRRCGSHASQHTTYRTLSLNRASSAPAESPASVHSPRLAPRPSMAPASGTGNALTLMEGLNGLFVDPGVGREVALWLDRADPAERQRFEGVFASLQQQMAQADLQLTVPPSGSAPVPAPKHRKPRPVQLPPVGQARPTTSDWSYASTKGAEGQRQAPAATQPRPASSEEAAAKQQLALQEQRCISAPHGRLQTADPSKERDKAGEASREKNPFISTYQCAYNAQTDHPELYSTVDSYVKPERLGPLPAECAKSLRGFKDDASRQCFMKSSYSVAYEDVIQEETEFDLVKEKAFFEKWMLWQKTYYGDLLLQLPQQYLERMFKDAPLEQKRDILESLRQVYTIASPETLQLRSHSQTVHGEMRSTEDPELQALQAEMTRIKAWGMSAVKAEADVKAREAQRIAAANAARPADQAQPSTMPQILSPVARALAANNNLWARPATSSTRPLDLTFPATAASTRPGAAGGSASAASSPRGGAGAAAPASPWHTPPRSPAHSEPAASAAHLADHSLPESMRPLTSLAQKQACRLNGGASPMRPGTSAGGAGAVSPTRLRHRKKKPLPTNQLTSNVPLDWPGYIPGNTTYKDTFNAAGHSPGRPERFKCIGATSCPAGALNMRLATVPLRASYPLPECFPQRLPFPGPFDDATENRSSYYARSSVDMARTAQEMASNAGLTLKAGRRTTLPFGKGGVNLPAANCWETEQQSGFTAHDIDVQAQREVEATIQALHKGPTASTGMLTGMTGRLDATLGSTS